MKLTLRLLAILIILPFAAVALCILPLAMAFEAAHELFHRERRAMQRDIDRLMAENLDLWARLDDAADLMAEATAMVEVVRQERGGVAIGDLASRN